MAFRSPSMAAAIAGAALLISTACGDDDGDLPPPDMEMPNIDGMVDGGSDATPPDGMMPTGELFPPPVIMDCAADGRPAPADLCDVTMGSAGTLITATVLVPGTIYHNGKVLVGADGKIACVGCDCASAEATDLYCPEAVLSPGLINAHDHVTFDNSVPYAQADMFSAERYEHRHEWRRGADGHTRITSGGGMARTEEMQWVELRQMLSGTTSINGSGGSAGLLRNLDNGSGRQEGLGEPAADYDTFPLGRDSALLTEGCEYDSRVTTDRVNMEDAYVPHVAEGIDTAARNEFLCMREGMFDAVQPQSAFIHGAGLLAPDIAEMATDGTELIWSPRTNISLYGDTARVSTYAQLGATIALGTDWVRTGSMNMLRELACADSFNQNHLAGFFPDEQLWLMATRNSARAFNMDDVIGSIEVGLFADLALYDGRTNKDHRAVIMARTQDVLLVMRGGQVFTGDAALVGALRTGCESLPEVYNCGRALAVCLQGLDRDPTLQVLISMNADNYPLLFCGEPEFEPTCVPERNAMAPLPDPVENGSNRYTGMSVAADPDGDGIMDADDNCPMIFNPVRPLDNGSQADFDADGIGDECDVCPLGGDDDPATCVVVDPNDRDGDGVTGAQDNCPATSNSDQLDTDMDGKGDACDACPMDPNPGGAGCPATVYDVRMGAVDVGAVVSVEGLVVTALVDGENGGFYAQLDPAHPDYNGVDFSGIYVASPGAAVSRGDIVTATGMYQDLFGQAQLGGATVMVTGSTTEPGPVVVAPAVIETMGARAEALESTLVRVESVTVADAALGFGEFSVTDGPVAGCAGDTCLRIDDEVHLIDPFPSTGEQIVSITGVLGYAFDDFKIRPRDASDVVFPGLRVSPGAIRARVGSAFTVAVSIPGPAPAGGATVTVAIVPAGIATGPAVITVPQGSTVGMASYTARATPGMGTFTVSYLGMNVVIAVDVVEPTGDGLLFTEYVEGSSFNKALEISNLSSAAVDLSGCELRRYTNGGTGTMASTMLSGTLAVDTAFVLCNAQIADTSNCDLINGIITHNGNDAYELVCDGMVVDTFGSTMSDPGTEWSGNGVSSANQTLRRLCTVSMGDTDLSDAFDPSTGWGSFPMDDLSGLGTPTCAP